MRKEVENKVEEHYKVYVRKLKILKKLLIEVSIRVYSNTVT